jgi:hypothetical protein
MERQCNQAFEEDNGLMPVVNRITLYMSMLNDVNTWKPREMAASPSWIPMFTGDPTAPWDADCTGSRHSPTCRHHPVNKRGVVSTLVHRAKAICDSNSLLRALKVLYQTFRDNGHSERQNLGSLSPTRAAPQRKESPALVAVPLPATSAERCLDTAGLRSRPAFLDALNIIWLWKHQVFTAFLASVRKGTLDKLNIPLRQLWKCQVSQIRRDFVIKVVNRWITQKGKQKWKRSVYTHLFIINVICKVKPIQRRLPRRRTVVFCGRKKLYRRGMHTATNDSDENRTPAV